MQVREQVFRRAEQTELAMRQLLVSAGVVGLVAD
jgi:hypothetical protein